ncbi:unnamed protein product [Blepharisma stoltei]|uniref:DAGKc domain-containing protein n=1 Tax=Blepharisma stoltei TaxID=1481888 RepID=A0AAU9JEB3_9CILI|nr:unnamed protein product [Blepharisma stoltei]
MERTSIESQADENQIFQEEVWTDHQHNINTDLKLTKFAISWKNTSKCHVYEAAKIIGAKLSPNDPTSTSIMIYKSVSRRFKIYHFWLSTADSAKNWTEQIRTYSNTHQENRHIAIILNPISGTKSSRSVFRNEFQPALNYSGVNYTMFETAYPNFIEDWVKSQDVKQYTDIVCMGGDGTMHLLITALNKYHEGVMDSISFGMLPTGTRNALSIEIGSKTATQGIANIIKRRTFKGDIIKVMIESNCVLATTAVAWGIVSDLCEEAQHYRFLGTFRYTAAGIKRVWQSWKVYSSILHYESKSGDLITHDDDFTYVVIGNHRILNTANNEIMTPKARINDGMLDLLMVRCGGKWELLRVFQKTMNFGSHLDSENVRYVKTKQVMLEPKHTQVFNVDGEMYHSPTIQIQILPKSISYLGQTDY